MFDNICFIFRFDSASICRAMIKIFNANDLWLILKLWCMTFVPFMFISIVGRTERLNTILIAALKNHFYKIGN